MIPPGFQDRTIGFALWHLNCYFERAMLWVVFILLVVLWLVGVMTAYTFGGFIHLLLVIALTVLLAEIMSRQRTV